MAGENGCDAAGFETQQHRRAASIAGNRDPKTGRWMMQPDVWNGLRKYTSARIALGRAGGSLPTGEVLDFSWAHAEARDAVHAQLDVQKIAGEIEALGVKCLE